MRILFLSHFFPPTHTAGAENYTFNVARGLAQQGHDIYVLCAGKWDEGERYWNGYTDEVYEGIHVRRLMLNWSKAADPNGYLFDNPETASFLATWLAEIEPAVAHITSCYTLSSSVIDVCRRHQIPTVLTLVDFWFLCPLLHLLRRDGVLCDGLTTDSECLSCLLHGTRAGRWSGQVLGRRGADQLLRAASERTAVSRLRGLRGLALNMAERKRILSHRLRSVDVILAPSRFIAETHEAAIGPLPQLRDMPYGHDLSWAQRLPTKSEREGTRFCYLGRISPEKGTHLLLEAFLKLQPVTDISVDIWGTLGANAYSERVKSLAERSERIRLRGPFSRVELAAVLSEADAVVVPSIWYENNPLVIQEAFAARAPVLAANLGGMAEFVRHEVDGLLFAPRDLDSLAGTMARFAADPALRGRLRESIPAVRDIATEVTDLQAIYRDLMVRRSDD